jgi:nicotinamidase-related amidase
MLYVTDMQEDFVSPTGKLYVDKAEEILNAVDILIESHRLARELILFGQDWHTLESKEISDNPDFVTKFPSHCLQRSDGAEMVIEPFADAIIVPWDKPFDGDVTGAKEIVIQKDDFNVFTGNPHTVKVVDQLPHQNRITICGVAGDVCVDMVVNEFCTRYPNTVVEVVRDAIRFLPNRSEIEIVKITNNWAEYENFRFTDVNEVVERLKIVAKGK